MPERLNTLAETRAIVPTWFSNLLLRLFARKDSNEGCRHEPSGLITGFTHDAKVIGRCAVCNIPIILNGLRVAWPFVERDARARAAEAEADFLLPPQYHSGDSS